MTSGAGTRGGELYTLVAAARAKGDETNGVRLLSLEGVEPGGAIGGGGLGERGKDVRIRDTVGALFPGKEFVTCRVEFVDATCTDLSAGEEEDNFVDVAAERFREGSLELKELVYRGAEVVGGNSVVRCRTIEIGGYLGAPNT